MTTFKVGDRVKIVGVLSYEGQTGTVCEVTKATVWPYRVEMDIDGQYTWTDADELTHLTPAPTYKRAIELVQLGCSHEDLISRLFGVDLETVINDACRGLTD